MTSPRIALSEAEREALRCSRRNRRMHIKELARALGVAPSTLEKWQLGYRRPTSDQLMRWWRAVNAPD